MRQAVVKLPRPKKHIREWTPLTVCGEVYKHAIYELTTDVSRLTPSDQRGWLAEFQKARKAYFYLLSDEQHEELEVLAGKWERNGVPKPLKKKYVQLVPQTRPQPHVDYQAVPEELQAYAEGRGYRVLEALRRVRFPYSRRTARHRYSHKAVSSFR